MKSRYYLWLRYEGRHPDTPNGGALSVVMGWWDGEKVQANYRVAVRYSVEQAARIAQRLEEEGFTIRDFLLSNPDGITPPNSVSQL